ncbi:dynein regulatory complex subunit 3 [Selaginella moellendorffii]|uniref:dynein regulatory complex subunit 3 n=1 Tax=Selaginella moellendorffii TaxID=88036 RepID=UPI000D1CBE98|nr:dynein regulatory complex subunit 3 [Selaginella moellendorffii]|eukprot:XP_024523575.1 dynein regulatory complex subunit 3 [Selaginella moellendorffii]
MAVTAVTTDLLRSCIKVEGGSPEKLEERKRTMPLSTVTCLIFSFKCQRSINWLHGLGSLTKLYLDNNDISKIENLSHLATLKLLDLSFNKIKSIGGLETLTNLEDLSLYHNEIEKITGLDTLQKITSFSLGKNRIRRLEDVIPLRRLRNLHVLTLDGNPLATDPEYRIYVISHLRDLTYFDHRYVDRAAVNISLPVTCLILIQQVVAARDQYQDDMTDLKQKEAEEDLLIKAAEEHATRQALYKVYITLILGSHFENVQDANLLGCDTLFERMISEDVEYPKLSQVPGLLASMDEYFRLVSPHVDFDILAEVRLNSSTADKKLALLREDNDRTREKLLELEMFTFGEVHLMAQASLLMEQFSLGELEVDSDEGRMEDQRLRGEEEMQKAMNIRFRQEENKRNRERIEEIDFLHQTTIDEITDLLGNLEVGNVWLCPQTPNPSDD